MNWSVAKETNFVNLIDTGDPVEPAVEYNKQSSADEIVFLDIAAVVLATSIFHFGNYTIPGAKRFREKKRINTRI